MPVQTIQVSKTIAAPRERVWSLLADVTTWSAWGPFDRSELETPGVPYPDGVGAVRRFHTDGRRTREVITGFDPPKMLSYDLLEGIPVRGYSARVELTACADGTVVTWRSRFRASIPGTGPIIRRRLEGYIERILLGLQAQIVDGASPRADTQD